MREFTYNSIGELIICTALPTQKESNKKTLKSIAVFEQTTADLGYLAAKKILESNAIDRNEIGVLLLLTKTPDYRGPATAMVLQNRLEIPQDCIVYDSPTGNGGFESGLNLGASLLNSTTKNYALIVFGDTISKQLSEQDIENLTFQDGATAILLQKVEASSPLSISTITLSENWTSFMVPSGGFRNNSAFFDQLNSKRENQSAEHLHFNTSEVNSTVHPQLEAIKERVSFLIDQNKTSDFAVIFNLVTPELEKELKSIFQSEKYSNAIYLSSDYFPQTMASTVPLLLEKIISEKELLQLRCISVSLGEGLCIHVSSVEVKKSAVLETIYSDAYYDNGFVTHEM